METSAESRQVAADAQALYERFAGGLADRQAAAVISAYADNGGYQECVEAKGLAWKPGWQKAISYADPSYYFTGNLFVTPPARTMSYYYQVNAGAGHLEVARGNSVADPALDKAISACHAEGHGIGVLLKGENVRALLRPPVSVRLEAAWGEAVSRAIAPYGNDSDVYRCLAASELGAPFTGAPGEYAMNWSEQARAQIPPGDQVPWDGEAASPGWTRALLAEEKLAMAVWECHADTYDRAMATLPGVMKSFEVEHADRIREAEAAWSATREVATRIGWTPEDPLAGLDHDTIEYLIDTEQGALP